MSKPMRYLHNGNIGDVWASLPSLREFHRKSGRKAILYLVNGQKAFYYKGASHPTKNEMGEHVQLNLKAIEMMLPLLKAQPYIEDAKVWEDEEFEIDLCRIRDTNSGMPNFCISRWYSFVWPDFSTDLTEKWLEVPYTDKDLAKGKIIITRSERYHNEYIRYDFLKPYEEDLLFVGTMREWNMFGMEYDLVIKKHNIKDFLELAHMIKQCRFHISNQTQAFQLSQGMKTPRILESCNFAPNCIPIGKDAYDFLSQDGLEYHFHNLYGDLQQYLDNYNAPYIEQKTAQ